MRLPKRRTVETNASIIKRFIAFAVDLLIVNFVFSIPFRIYISGMIPPGPFNETYALMTSDPQLLRITYMATAIMTIVFLLYFTLFNYSRGQTLGMMLLKIEVKPLDRKLFLWKCLVRNLFIIPYFPFILLWVIDPVYIFFNRENQRLTERFSRTKVIEKVHY